MGAADGTPLHRARGRRGRGERLGAGAVPDGRASRRRRDLRDRRWRGRADAGVHGRRASRHPAHRGRGLDAPAREPLARAPGGESRRRPSPRRPAPAAALHLPLVRRGARTARPRGERRVRHGAGRAGRAPGAAGGCVEREGGLMDDHLLPLVLLGAVFGLDVVSFPQAMLSRPLVAATVAGAVVGDAGAGLLVGVGLELIALETLPVGASRYPEWGSASVVGGALMSTNGEARPGALTLAMFAAL